MANWLKSTVPGIVVLGAIGSLVAVGALRAFKAFIAPALLKFLGRRLLPVILDQATIAELQANARTDLLVGYMTALGIEAIGDTVFFCASCVAAVAYFSVRGVNANWPSVALISLMFVTLTQSALASARYFAVKTVIFSTWKYKSLERLGTHDAIKQMLKAAQSALDDPGPR